MLGSRAIRVGKMFERLNGLISSVLPLLTQQKAVVVTSELRCSNWQGHWEKILTSVNL